MERSQDVTLSENHSPRQVNLDQHESVRSHINRQLRSEVCRLERRIETLRLTKAPHAAIMIATYERMIDRKKGFMRNWEMPVSEHC
ncbi:MAG: hypothetical protein SVX28_09070 [Pseudomonadota bacterium]|nr:hypothetical protein [Pseudomonadota bacterium]